MTTRERIVAILEERYVCGALPFGAQLAIAHEVGVTRQRVHQIVREHGYGRILQRDVKKQQASRCKQCGAVKDRQGWYCASCAFVPVVCDECGTTKLRTRNSVLRNAVNPKTAKHFTGRYFCDRTCWARWTGKHHGWGNPDHPIHHQTPRSLGARVARVASRIGHGASAYTNYGCRCGVCRAGQRIKSREWYVRRKERQATEKGITGGDHNAV